MATDGVRQLARERILREQARHRSSFTEAGACTRGPRGLSFLNRSTRLMRAAVPSA